jgi:hypothetical protein
MATPGQSRQDLESRARDVLPLQAPCGGREQTFRYVGTAGKPHLGDDANPPLPEDALSDLGQDHAARGVGRRQLDPQSNAEREKKDREKPAG